LFRAKFEGVHEHMSMWVGVFLTILAALRPADEAKPDVGMGKLLDALFGHRILSDPFGARVFY
jgi:hypothetical protein